MSEAVRRLMRDRHSAAIAEGVEALDSPDFAAIAPALREGLRRYLEDRIETGSFLRAYLENDLFTTLRQAHPLVSMDVMRSLRDLLIGYFPQTAWGSREKVAAWLAGADTTDRGEPT